MLKGKLLRKLSETCYVEDVQNDIDPPLEWQLGFNCISLKIDNISVVNQITTQEKPIIVEEEHKETPCKQITPNVAYLESIQGTVDFSKTGKEIYLFTNPNRYTAPEIYTDEYLLNDTVKIEIRPGEGTYKERGFQDGVYRGYLHYSPGLGSIMKLLLPQNQFDAILKSIQSYISTQIDIDVELLSYNLKGTFNDNVLFLTSESVSYYRTDAFINETIVRSKMGNDRANGLIKLFNDYKNLSSISRTLIFLTTLMLLTIISRAFLGI